MRRTPWIAAIGAAAGVAVTAAVARRRRERRRAITSETLPRAAWEAQHAAKVQRIAAALAARRDDRPVSLRKKAVSHQVPKPQDLRFHDDKIDVSELTQILEIDPTRRICVAESGVTFVDLVAATLRHGLVPYIVPELKTITIGGAVSGCSIESASFRHGGFHDTCVEYEVITGDGEVLTCTPDNEHRLVFQMVHGSFGTLGILSKLTFRLRPAKPFVHVVYETYRALDDYLRAIRTHAARRDVDFIDGIIHSPTQHVLGLGRFVDEAPYTSRYDWMKIYYRSTATRDEDYLTTEDYFFRYDRGVTNVHPRSFLGRLLFGKLAGSAVVLRAAERLRWLRRTDRPTVTLDLFLPVSRVPRFFTWYRRAIDYFPLWVVPYRRVRDYEWIDPSFYAGLDDDLFLDLAIYGLEQPPGRNLHREIEEALQDVGGIKTLIAHNYYAEDEFWSIWNRPNYAAAKAVTDPRNRFRDLYAKTCRAAMGLR